MTSPWMEFMDRTAPPAMIRRPLQGLVPKGYRLDKTKSAWFAPWVKVKYDEEGNPHPVAIPKPHTPYKGEK